MGCSKWRTMCRWTVDGGRWTQTNKLFHTNQKKKPRKKVWLSPNCYSSSFFPETQNFWQKKECENSAIQCVYMYNIFYGVCESEKLVWFGTHWEIREGGCFQSDGWKMRRYSRVMISDIRLNHVGPTLLSLIKMVLSLDT